jgi:hypothetical protein
VLNAGVDDAKKWIPAYTSLGAKHENRWSFANYGGLTGLSHLTIGQVHSEDLGTGSVVPKQRQAKPWLRFKSTDYRSSDAIFYVGLTGFEPATT